MLPLEDISSSGNKNMKCHQCETQAMFMVGPNEQNQLPLCLHCSTKLKQAETNRIKALQQGIAYCEKTMAFQLGFDTSPVSMKTVEIGDVTLNHINISGSNIGLINTGKIQVESIDLSIDTLINNNQKELSDAIKKLTDAIIQEQQINDANKAEIIEWLSYIAEESTKPPQYRKKTLIIKAIEKIGVLIVAESVRRIWEYSCPIIESYFS